MRNLAPWMEEITLSCRTLREVTERSFQELEVEDYNQAAALLDERQRLIDRIVPLMKEVAALLAASPDVGVPERKVLMRELEKTVRGSLEADGRCIDLVRGRMEALEATLQTLRDGSRALSGYLTDPSIPRPIRFHQDV